MIAETLDRPLDPLADLAQDIDRLQAEDLHLAPSCELGPRLKALRVAINRLEAESARTLEVFDRTQAYGLDGGLSAASWLRYHCNLSYGAASDQVQRARRLPELPKAQRAFTVGEIGPTHTSLMTRTADQMWNIYLTCRPHHRLVHESGWGLERQSDGSLTAIPP
jgi:hypothetical protein